MTLDTHEIPSRQFLQYGIPLAVLIVMSIGAFVTINQFASSTFKDYLTVREYEQFRLFVLEEISELRRIQMNDRISRAEFLENNKAHDSQHNELQRQVDVQSHSLEKLVEERTTELEKQIEELKHRGQK